VATFDGAGWKRVPNYKAWFHEFMEQTVSQWHELTRTITQQSIAYMCYSTQNNTEYRLSRHINKFDIYRERICRLRNYQAEERRKMLVAKLAAESSRVVYPVYKAIKSWLGLNHSWISNDYSISYVTRYTSTQTSMNHQQNTAASTDEVCNDSSVSSHMHAICM